MELLTRLAIIACTIAGTSSLVAVAAQTDRSSAAPSAQSRHNLARNARYECVTKPNYWGWKNPHHGDTGQLTDGVSIETWSTARGEFYSLPSSMGWTGVEPVVVVDLGEERSIGGIGLHSVLSPWGPWWPESIVVLVSSDNRSFHLAATVHVEFDRLDPPVTRPVVQAAIDRKPVQGPSTHWLRMDLMEASGRYVALIMAPPADVGTIVVDEIEIYAGSGRVTGRKRTGPTFSEGPAGIVSFRLHRAMNRRISLDLESIRRKVDVADVSAAARERLAQQLTRLERERQEISVPQSETFRAVLPVHSLHERLFAVGAALWREQNAPPLRLWHSHRLDPLGPLEEPRGEMPQIHADMAINAIASDAVNLSNSVDRPLAVSLSVAGLPADCVQLFEVPLVDTHAFEPVAAALVKLEERAGTYSVQIPSGMTRQVWLRFHSTQLKPGRYHGELHVAIEGEATSRQAVPISIEVFAVTMPDRYSIKVGGWDYSTPGNYQVTSENVNEYVSMLKQYGVNVTWSNDAMPAGSYDANGTLIGKPPRLAMDRWLDQWPDAQVYAVVIGHVFPLGTPHRAEMVRQWASDWSEYLQSRGVAANRVAMLIQDEPTSEAELNAILETATAVRKGGEFKIFNDLHFPDPTRTAPVMTQLMERACDIQCFSLGHLLHAAEAHRTFMNRHARPNLEWWCYTGGDSHRLTDPYVTWLLRSWFCFDQGFSGAHFWSFGDGNGGFSWNEYLNDGVTRSPLYLDRAAIVPSKSMEAMREGAQDYELLRMVRRKLQQGAGSREQADGLRQILDQDVPRVLAAHRPDAMPWNTAKDRSIADIVRRRILGTLSLPTDR